MQRSWSALLLLCLAGRAVLGNFNALDSLKVLSPVL
jgi:hypothetical protein